MDNLEKEEYKNIEKSEEIQKLKKLEELKKIVKKDEIFNKLDDNTLLESIDAMENLSSEDIEKYKQYQKTVLSMGIPTCRIMMQTLLQKSESTDESAKFNFYQKIEELTNIEKVGGMNIEYEDMDTGKKTFFYIIMNKCHKDHDLNMEFNKIKKNFSEETWKQLLKHVSMLIYLCRSIYKINMQACINDIFHLGFDINEIEELKIDPRNTTLYINEEWDERMGIYIMRECDLEEEGVFVSNTNEVVKCENAGAKDENGEDIEHDENGEDIEHGENVRADGQDEESVDVKNDLQNDGQDDGPDEESVGEENDGRDVRNDGPDENVEILGYENV